MSAYASLPEVPLNKPVLNGVPLIVESHPESYTGSPFLTLIQYNTTTDLVVVDNYVNGTIRAYALDYCDTVNLDIEKILDVADNWYHNNRQNYPISVEFGKLGIAQPTSMLLRIYNADYIQRIIGPVPRFVMGSAHTTVRRRKCTHITPSEASEIVRVDSHFQSI